MLHLHPAENFKIVYVISDTADTNTYYIRSVIRDADDNILKTINLVDNGSRRFTGNWEVTSRIGANGSYIDITTTVYTDSGYTTKSSSYGEKNETCLVQERLTRVDMPIGGADISYKKVAKVMKDELKNRDMVEVPKTDLSGVEMALENIITQIAGIEMPEIKETDFAEVTKRIEVLEASVLRAISSKAVTPATDLKPMVKKNTEENNKLLKTIAKELSSLKSMIVSDNKSVKDFIGKTGDRFDVSDNIRKVVGGGKPSETKQVEPPVENNKRRFLRQPTA